jgi:iron complex outermembrane receptor protein
MGKGWSGAAGWLTCLLTLAASLPTAAQEEPPDFTGLSLEQLGEVEIVYAAARREQRTREAAASVSIVTAADIRDHGYRTLADILRTLPGFYVTYDRNYSYLGVRGFGRPGDYNTRILLLVDGLRVNDNVYDEALIGQEFLVDPEVVERVEVVRGPGAALYGNSAFFAVVNVVTRRGIALGSEVTATGASFGTWQGRASYGKQFEGGVDVLVSASRLGSDGQRLYFPEFDSPATNQGVVAGGDDEHADHLLAKVTRGGWALEAARVSREKGIPTASFDTVFGDTRTRTTDTLSRVVLGYEGGLGASGARQQARLHYGLYDYRGTYILEGAPEPVVNRDSARGEWVGLDWGVSRKAGSHNLSLGGDIQRNLHQDQRSYDEAPFLEDVAAHSRSTRWGLYAQDEVQVSKVVSLVLGGRYDRTDAFGDTVNPRLGLVYHPGPRTTLKLLAGRAFRAPNEFETRYYGEASRDLVPESIRTLEVHGDLLVGGRIRLSAGAFLNRIDDLVSLTTGPQGDLRYENARPIDSRGVEAGAEAQVRGARGSLTYEFQDTREAGTSQQLTNSPRHMARFAFTVPLPGSTLGVDAQYLSPRRTLSGGRADGFVVVNCTVTTRHLFWGLELSGSLYNALDRRYADPGSEEHRQDAIAQDGRSFRVRATWHF